MYNTCPYLLGQRCKVLSNTIILFHHFM